jgi:hypothetical protein
VRRSLELISSRPAWAKYRAVISKQKVKKKKKKNSYISDIQSRLYGKENY